MLGIAWAEHLQLQVKACLEPSREREREKPEGSSGVNHVRLRHSRADLVPVDADNRQGHSYLCSSVCSVDRDGHRSISSKGCGILASQARGSLSRRVR